MVNSKITTSRAFYSSSIAEFVHAEPVFVLGRLIDNSGFSVEITQRDAWRSEVIVLQDQLSSYVGRGSVYFEFAVPRLGKRIDVLVLINHVIFVIEFKVGETLFHRHAIDQVWDYALDLKNFHETSHHCMIAPILIATNAISTLGLVPSSHHNDGVLEPIKISPDSISETIKTVLRISEGKNIVAETWEGGRY